MKKVLIIVGIVMAFFCFTADGKLLTENQILGAHDFIEALNTLLGIEAFVIEEEED